MLIFGTEIFRNMSFDDEAELETLVEDNSKLLFGNSTIYLSKKTLIRTGDGRGTIPDAFVIDYENDVWYMVEVELIEHGVWRHIVPQITNQIVACLNQETRNLLTDRVLEYINSTPALSKVQGLQQSAVSILRKDPMIAIPIDGSSEDLETWAQTQKFQVSIWVIQKLVSVDDPSRIAFQLPDNNEPSVITQAVGQPITVVRRSYLKHISQLLDAGLISDGEELSLNYRGKQFSGLARREGIELRNGVFSPSVAAIRCYAESGSSRPTENGWRVWKNKNGLTLNELFDHLQSRTPRDVP